MPALIVIDGVRTGYAEVIKRVSADGQLVAPRGQMTKEITGATLHVLDPEDVLPPLVRKPAHAITAAESLQLIGGVSHPELMRRIAPNFGRFTDGGIFHGAYGPRLREQVPLLVQRLERDPSSRQAVLTIWEPLRDLVGDEDPPRDVPCTIAMQFLLRDGLLEQHVTMRSNDVWLGLAYDVAQFTALGWTIAWQLNTALDSYVHHAGSLHLYERNWLHAKAVTVGTSEGSGPPLFGVTGDSIHDAQRRARALLTGSLRPETPSEEWYTEQLAPYL